MLCIQPGVGAGCGACEAVCPVEAIFCKDGVPGQWARFTIENARLFGQIGSPGGASAAGVLPRDTGYAADASPAADGAGDWPTAAHGVSAGTHGQCNGAGPA